MGTITIFGKGHGNYPKIPKSIKNVILALTP